MKTFPPTISMSAILSFAMYTIAGIATAADTHEWLEAETATPDADGNILWYDALHVGLEGQGWKGQDLEHPYDRLPIHAKSLVTKSVWGLSHNSAGLLVRFTTDSPTIAARWSLRKPTLELHHMPSSGVSGLDLYAKDGDHWRWVAAASPKQQNENLKALVVAAPPGMHDYILALPLYNGTEKLEIGIARESKIARAQLRPETNRKPLVFYGTSITQGGTVSRTGMAYPAILGRRLLRENINLGFSGNGRMEIEMADMLAELDAAVYVLDCLPNMNADTIHQRFTPFVQSLRKARPHTPIVLVENITYQGAWFSTNTARHVTSNEALREEYEQLRGLGIQGLTYVSGENLLGEDGLGTVDGTHPNDLGMLRLADALEPAIRSALKR